MELLETWMIFMIKKIFILLSISSCSIIGFGELPSLVRDTVLGTDFEVTDDFYKSQPYSFAKINIGRKIVAITVLASVSNGIYLWISADGERIYTKNGKIIRTFGLKHDMKFLDPQNIDFPTFQFFESNNTYQNSLLLELNKPMAIINYSLLIKEIGIDEDYYNSMKYEEQFKSGKLAWNMVNNYWFDRSGRVIKSTQYIHPMMPKISLEFYYK